MVLWFRKCVTKRAHTHTDIKNLLLMNTVRLKHYGPDPVTIVIRDRRRAAKKLRKFIIRENSVS